jgi:DNA-binding NarL/FixJ family response regulator
MEVMGLLAHGAANKEITARLHITARTVKAHKINTTHTGRVKAKIVSRKGEYHGFCQ